MAATSTPIELPFGPHWKGLRSVEGFHQVRARLVRETTAALIGATEARSMLLVVGPPGVGKSFTVARALERALSRSKNRSEAQWLDYSTWARGMQLVRELHDQLIGDGLSDTPRSPRRLRHDVRIALVDRQRILVVDEAQWVSSESLIFLSKLIDQPDTDFGLVIIATPELFRKLPETVDSRLYARVRIEPLADREVTAELGEYHDIFATANPKRLEYINRTKAAGQFRYWAQFLTMWWTLRDHVGYELTDEVLDIVADAVAPKHPKAHR